MSNSYVKLLVDQTATGIEDRINKLIDKGWELRGQIIFAQDGSGAAFFATLVRETVAEVKLTKGSKPKKAAKDKKWRGSAVELGDQSY